MSIESVTNVAVWPRPTIPQARRDPSTAAVPPPETAETARRVTPAERSDGDSRAYRVGRTDGEPTDPDRTGGATGRIDVVV